MQLGFGKANRVLQADFNLSVVDRVATAVVSVNRSNDWRKVATNLQQPISAPSTHL
jgi:hypothetical protein